MARLIYALSGQGRGHSSRVLAISEALRQRGHEVWFCCGGTAREVLHAQGERVLPVPALLHAMDGNSIQVFATLLKNWRAILTYPGIVARLAEAFERLQPDLLITDFETFSARAARRIGLPVLSFNHQQVVTETMYDLPSQYSIPAWLSTFIIKLIAPKDPVHILLSSFFFPPLRDPAHTTLVPPIIRPAVQALEPSQKDHMLVYFNETDGSSHVLDQLRQVDARFIVYNFSLPDRPQDYPNLTFKEPSLDGFLEDLASCRAVLCTAGFTLISEALFLGKPLLVVPNRGIFEQTINALFLQRKQFGEAVLDRPIQADDLTGFLNRLDTYTAHLRHRPPCGNQAALDCIERVLAHGKAVPHGRAPMPPHSVSSPSFPNTTIHS